ncbi:serine/threonine protein kinase [Streptomyces oryzae]|uniref:non-specific serine/threonine protein kinase n=1 Tax=Streptomyces oryzae TaxID=1434886 RepID=A0ABS3X7R4_9ACTN|nr:serine/threonine protein kinase [Streptomyces oryzae]
MGHVWEAQDETLHRRVAVKVISLLAGGGRRGDEARARFLREARITARLQHAHIVTIHDLGETGPADNRVPFLVMEFVRGEGLDTKLRRGALALSDAARWGAQIAEALAEAHAAGITHRDIKPSNILITPAGNVKVLDFGVARAADPGMTGDRLTRTGFIVGTPPYMAPEQARGLPEPRSDLYALGCLLFELITGRLPFQAPDTVGYLSAHLTQEPPAPSTVLPGIPAAWDDLVLTLLCKDPGQRYAAAAGLAQALWRLGRAPEPDTLPYHHRTRTRPGPTRPRTARTVPDGAHANPPAQPPAQPLAQPPDWRAFLTALERFVLPAVLLVLYGVAVRVAFADSYYGHGYWTVGSSLAAGFYTLLLVGALVLAAALTPRSSALIRWVGFTAAALFALFTAVPLFLDLPLGLIGPVAVLALAVFCSRDIRTRRARIPRGTAG